MAKKLIIYIIVVLVSYLHSHVSLAADRVELKFRFTPMTDYRIEDKLFHRMTIALENPLLAREEMRDQFPVSMESREDKVVEVVTGSFTDKKSYPITVELLKDDQIVSVNGSPQQNMNTSGSILLGVSVHGMVYSNGQTKFTAVDGKELSEEKRKIILSIFEQVLKAFNKLEAKSAAVGESIIQKEPLDIQIPGVGSFKMDMTGVYRLVKIEDGLAYFDTSYTFNFIGSTDPKPTNKIEGSGDGVGKFIYSINYRTRVKDGATIKGKMTIPTDHGKLIVSIHSITTSTVKVESRGDHNTNR